MTVNHFSKTDRSHFFRYMDATGAIATLESGSWRLTSPGNLNDPEDLVFKKVLPYSADEMMRISAESMARALRAGKIPPLLAKSGRLPSGVTTLGSSPLSHDEWVKEFMADPKFVADYRARHERLTDEMNKELCEAFNDHFLLCLTTDRASAKMWEQYGDNHRGVAFRIECLPDEDNVVRAAQEVCYSDYPPTYGLKEEWLDLIEGGSGISVERLYKEAVTWKKAKWAHENEWRVIYIDRTKAREKHTKIPIRPREISEIYLGPKMDLGNIAKIELLVREAYPHTRVIKT